MNTKQKAVFSQMLASALGGHLGDAVRVHTIELDPSRDLDEQLQEFIMQREAEHREHCPDCAAAYAAQNGEGKQTSEGQDNAAMGARSESPKQAEPRMRIVGYMAFDNEQPIPGTFDVEYTNVEKGIEEFKKGPFYHLVNGAHGIDERLNVRPVYA